MASPAIGSSLSPQLEQLVQSFEQAKADARQLLTGSNEEVLRKRPSQDSWSALECVGHLNLGNSMMLAEIEKAIDQSRALHKAPDQNYKMDLIGKLMVWSFKPGRVKLKAPAAIAKPIQHGSAQKALSEFERHQDEAIGLIRGSAGLAIDRCKMKSPFASVRYSAYSAFEIIAAHNRRHLWQARNAVEKAASA